MSRANVVKLEPSKLRPQRELYGDIDLAELNLARHGAQSLSLEEHLTDATIERTIEGASTVTLTLNDYDRELLTSGRLNDKSDIRIDGLWFRLVSVRKNGDSLTLVFEDREIALLRTYNKPIHLAWGATTRTKFARRLVREVKETHIEFICPELPGQKVAKGGDGRWDTQDAEKKRHLGITYTQAKNGDVFVKGQDAQGNKGLLLVTVKGVPINASQIDIANRLLNVGMDRGARRKVMVVIIMTAIQESTLSSPDEAHSDGTSAGPLQLINIHGTEKQRRNIEFSANWFYDRAIQSDASHPDFNYGELAQSVQRSRYPFAYMKWRSEAEAIVDAFGLYGGDDANDASVYDANGMYEWDGAGDNEEYQFTRGQPVAKNGRQIFKRENSWKCLQRLAQEVNWRAFMVSGALYFISEPWLFKSKAFMTLSERTDGVDSIDGDYDTGKPNGSLTVTAHIDRWVCPPGGCVLIEDMGPLSGKWLVTTFSRSLFDNTAKITLKKPRPRLPEPTQDDSGDQWDASKESETSGEEGLTGPPASSGSVVFTPVALANRLLLEATKGNYRDDNGRQISQLRKIAAGKSLTNQCSQDVKMSAKVLGGLVYLIDRGFKVGTFALVEDHKCNDGQHPKGQAVDISSLGLKGESFFALNQFDPFAKQLAIKALVALKQYGAHDLICNGVGFPMPDVQEHQMDNGKIRGGQWETDHTNHIHFSV